MDPIKIINVVKYAKNHYQRTDNIWYDLALCLQADGYGPFFGWSNNPNKSPQEECFNNRRQLTMLIIDKLMPYIKSFRFREIITNTSPNDSWRVGYHTKSSGSFWANKKIDQLPDYDYWQALVMAYLSEMTFTCCEDLGHFSWNLFNGCNIPELKKEPKEAEQTIS